MSEHSGSCHCGDVQFKIDTTITEYTTCDCSLCVKKNAVMLKVHESEFTLLSDWSTVSLYEWNTRVAKHYFCKRCGIYPFHKKRSAPDHYGINVHCIDDLSRDNIAIRATQGVGMSLECDQPRSVWSGPKG